MKRGHVCRMEPGVVTKVSDALEVPGLGDQVGSSPGWRGTPRVIGQTEGLWAIDDCDQSLSLALPCPLFSAGGSGSFCQDIELYESTFGSVSTLLHPKTSKLINRHGSPYRRCPNPSEN